MHCTNACCSIQFLLQKLQTLSVLFSPSEPPKPLKSPIIAHPKETFFRGYICTLNYHFQRIHTILQAWGTPIHCDTTNNDMHCLVSTILNLELFSRYFTRKHKNTCCVDRVTEWLGVYGEGQFSFKSSWVYLVTIGNFSQIVS